MNAYLHEHRFKGKCSFPHVARRNAKRPQTLTLQFTSANLSVPARLRGFALATTGEQVTPGTPAIGRLH